MPVPVKVRALFVSARTRDEGASHGTGENTNGGQEVTQGGTQEQEVQGQQQEPQAAQEVGGNAGADLEAQIAQHDQRIVEREGQVTEVAKNAEMADKLSGECFCQPIVPTAAPLRITIV